VSKSLSLLDPYSGKWRLPSTGQPSEYSLDDVIDIFIEAAAMAEHNSLRLPGVDLSDRRLHLSPLDE
jgi:hypothetical protein